ncbi:MAG: ADP-ribosylglycohydrolase family protein, partial [Myxococcales bacterium]|nr:ADP-ribosylglycohydrolase family protein [Myxococcales bacterium]
LEESPRASGYVVDTLASSLYALRAGIDYASAIRHAVSLGNDTDTTAAIAGGLAGVREGALAIPDRWVRALRGRALLDPLLDRLLDVRAG